MSRPRPLNDLGITTIGDVDVLLYPNGFLPQYLAGLTTVDEELNGLTSSFIEGNIGAKFGESPCTKEVARAGAARW